MSTSESGPSSSDGPSSSLGLTLEGIPKFSKPVTTSTLSNLIILEGKENYQSWSDQMIMVFTATRLYDVVIEGAKVSSDDTNSEKMAYIEIKSAATIMFLQVISKQILVQCNRILDPHELWNHLKTQFYSDTPFSFIHRMNSLFTIGTSFDPFKPVSEFIDKFKTEWAMLTQLSTSGSTPYRLKLKEFLAFDEAKRDILLSILIPHMSNIIDNISTKDTMSYAEAKQRIVGLPSNQKDAAFIITSNKKSKKLNLKRKKTSDGNDNAANSGSTLKTKKCTWCKK